LVIKLDPPPSGVGCTTGHVVLGRLVDEYLSSCKLVRDTRESGDLGHHVWFRKVVGVEVVVMAKGGL
jgi:hypothetical protein